jgi:hypothetical protein
MAIPKGTDWELLRRQKLWLLGQDNELATGVVHLIDAIQDEAVDGGEFDKKLVFGEDYGKDILE